MHAALLLMAALTATDRVVVVTATSGFRHDSSIAAGEALIAAIAPSMGLDVTFVREEDEMAAALDADALRGVKMVMFVNTTGNLKHRGALLEWIRNGGSFIGVHAASDTWHEWPEYIEMLGGEFDRHPDQTTVDILVDERGHPSTNALEPPIHVFEEIYIFRNFELDRVRILCRCGRVLKICRPDSFRWRGSRPTAAAAFSTPPSDIATRSGQCHGFSSTSAER